VVVLVMVASVVVGVSVAVVAVVDVADVVAVGEVDVVGPGATAGSASDDAQLVANASVTIAAVR
jgi:hypothetical protein